MGIDLLDVAFRIEKAFHIELSIDDLSNLVRKQDIVVGDLYDFILKKMNLRDVGRHSLRLHEHLWSEMRSALHFATERPVNQIDLSLALGSLFPQETRRARWKSLRDVCPYKIPDLDYPKVVRIIGFLLTAGVVVIEQRQILQVPGANWLWPFLGLLAVWMVSETYVKVLAVLAPLRKRFPSGMRTVKDLCRGVLSANYSEICNDSDISLDERCSTVWENLVEILVAALGVAPVEVTFRSRLIADLGAD